ncbi:MAG: glycosyltransferase [Prevotella sp.]
MSTATTPKIAFLISAHTDPQQLARLIEALPRESRFFVHVDKKADIREFESAVRDIDGVSFTRERYNVMWGSFGQVRYQMALIRQALDEAPDAEYFFSLSGLDYPLWPAERISDAVRHARGRQFLYATPMAMLGDEARLYREYRLLNTRPWRYGTLKSKMRVLLRHLVKAVGVRKPLSIRSDSGRMYSLYKGGSWWGITRDLAMEALRMYDNDKRFTGYFVNAFGPDETFIHTVAMNNPQFASRSTLVRSTRLEDLSPLTYIEYGSEIKTFTEHDLDTLLMSGKMFCRKVVSGKSDTLVRLIGEHWTRLSHDTASKLPAPFASLRPKPETTSGGTTQMVQVADDEPVASSCANANGSNPAVTVIVPVYKVERYIEECASSLFGQTYENVEYIFCDDCSPDASISILRDALERFPHRKPHVRIVRNEKNSGLGASRRHLASLVSTPLFTIVDSDDVLPTDSIDVLVTVMRRTGTDSVEGAYTEYGGGRHSEPHLPYHGKDHRYKSLVLCQNIIGNHVWGRLYRSSLLERLPDAFIPGIDYAEDYCFSSRLAAIASRSVTDHVVYHYRIDNQTSYTKNVSHRSVMSYLRASAVVWRFYLVRGESPLALETGMLNTFRACHDASIAPMVAFDTTLYVPCNAVTHAIRHMLMSGGRRYAIGNFLYKLLRRYAAFIS